MAEKELNLDATELRLGLPGSQQEVQRTNKRSQLDDNSVSKTKQPVADQQIALPPKVQVVGWPPVRSFRKNCLGAKKTEKSETVLYVKVSMDGAPYLRKIDLNVYKGYPKLLQALEDMFKFKVGVYSEREGYNGSEYVPTYEDKDGDWMLVGDVPWE